ncbi:MAG: hypothetical protein ACO3JL_11320 [Myxococcota bacterium]
MAEHEDFEELRWMRDEVARRHRRLIVALLGVGVTLLFVGLGLYAWLDLERRPGLLIVPVGCWGFGLAVIVRALYSALTDVDTKARDDEVVGLPELARERGGAHDPRSPR